MRKKIKIDDACVCVYGINDLKKTTGEEESIQFASLTKMVEIYSGRDLIDQVIQISDFRGQGKEAQRW